VLCLCRASVCASDHEHDMPLGAEPWAEYVQAPADTGSGRPRPACSEDGSGLHLPGPPGRAVSVVGKGK
jgi:hypothetical protein